MNSKMVLVRRKVTVGRRREEEVSSNTDRRPLCLFPVESKIIIHESFHVFYTTLLKSSSALKSFRGQICRSRKREMKVKRLLTSNRHQLCPPSCPFLLHHFSPLPCPVSTMSEPPKNWKEPFEQGIASYKSKSYGEALIAFDLVSSRSPSLPSALCRFPGSFSGYL